MQKQTKFIIITLIPVLAVMGTIFYFSSQTADASTVTSGGFVETAMNLIEKLFGELGDKYTTVENTVTFIVRKAAHFLEFAALGFFLNLHLGTWVKRKPRLWSFLVSVLYACSDEFHQNFVSERAMQLRDVFVDSAGALAGIIGCVIIILIVKRIKKKKTVV